jgi:hypothetical protein
MPVRKNKRIDLGGVNLQSGHVTAEGCAVGPGIKENRTCRLPVNICFDQSRKAVRSAAECIEIQYRKAMSNPITTTRIVLQMAPHFVAEARRKRRHPFGRRTYVYWLGSLETGLETVAHHSMELSTRNRMTSLSTGRGLFKAIVILNTWIKGF